MINQIICFNSYLDNFLINEKCHELLLFLTDKISKENCNSLSIIKLFIQDISELESSHPDFNLINFLDDIRFVIMNIIGTGGLLNIYDNTKIFVILPNIDETSANEVVRSIFDELKNMFNEVFGSIDFKILHSIVTYLGDSKDPLTLLNEIINERVH